MKKLVIMMLALVLSLAAVSAMADEKSVTLKYSEPVVFEWSMPDEVTLTEEFFSDSYYAFSITLVDAKLKRNHIINVWASSFVMTNDEDEDSYIDMNTYEGTSFLESEKDVSKNICFTTTCDKEDLYPADYEGSTTFIAEIVPNL